MNETPAATPRVHAGCGHLCLTCGAQAAVRAVTSDVVINVCIIVSLAVATLLASVLVTHVIAIWSAPGAPARSLSPCGVSLRRVEVPRE